jgi:hypothetical protein
MYLYLKEVNLKYLDSKNKVDELNGLPVNTYLEVTSQFWNLIYKPSLIEDDIFSESARLSTHEFSALEGKISQRAQSISVVGLENQYRNHLKANMRLQTVSVVDPLKSFRMESQRKGTGNIKRGKGHDSVFLKK